MNKPVKDAMKQHYDQFALSGIQMKNLEQMQQAAVAKKQKPRFFMAFSAVAAVAAVFLLIGIGVWQELESTVRDQVANEVAYNHHKQLDMEITTSSLTEVKSYLAKLDFAMVDSNQLPGQQWELIGGRYCTIQNKLAAQLRVKHRPSNRLYTWYQIPDTKVFSELSSDYETYSQGVKIKFWKEKGIVHGLASIE